MFIRREKNKPAAVAFWALSALCMGAIFYFSSRTATVSSEQSGVFVAWLIAHFGESSLWVFLVRKSAHLMEFAGLGLLLSLALNFTRGKQSAPWALLIASLYAVSDEVHQIFVEGRSCELRDWAIDTVGAALGVLGCIILTAVIQAIINKRRNKG